VGVGYIWNSSELHPPSANTLSLLGQGTLLDASNYGSRTYSNTRIWQNLLPQNIPATELARLQLLIIPVDAALATTWLSMWSTHPSPQQGNTQRAQSTPLRGPLPYVGTHPGTAPFRVHNGILGRGMIYALDTPSTPTAEVREALMGFRVGDTAAPGL